MRRHQRLGELLGTGLLLGDTVRVTVNRSGNDVQLVLIGPDARAQLEVVPADDRDDLRGWIATAERTWSLRGYDWRFESVLEARARWQSPSGP